MVTEKPPRNTRTCPYCGSLFPKEPRKKTRCKSCGEDVYVRTKQNIFNSDLLTKDDTLAADFLKGLLDMGATEDDYFRTASDLAAKWGKEPSSPDVVWAVSNRLIMKPPRSYFGGKPDRESLFQHAKMVTFLQARYQGERGNNPAKLLNVVNNYDLKILDHAFRSPGLKIEICTNSCCEKCKSLYEGKIYTMAQLKEKSVLPVIECTNLITEDRPYSWCTCFYGFVGD